MNSRVKQWLFLSTCLLMGCSGPVASTDLQPTPSRIVEATPIARLAVGMIYPKPDTEIEMGQSTRLIVSIDDAMGRAVSDAQVTITVRDSNDKVIAVISALPYTEGTFRTQGLVIPHSVDGRWSAQVDAKTSGAQGNGIGAFRVKKSPGDVLLAKYGFWLDAPRLNGITPALYAERGDAQNGMIRWGGAVPGGHVMAENWVELHWRVGDQRLTDANSVRRFLLEDLGDLGFVPIRELGTFQSVRFKQWSAWRAGARAQLSYQKMEWMVFYAPEVDKTFALATMVVLPPDVPDPLALLRDSFAVHPEIHAVGVAPEPLPHLLPGPELASPPLGARFEGTSQPIVLQWMPVKSLDDNEYYRVAVDYNYGEANTLANFATRETKFTLPETLYRTPNCRVFNWQVTLMHQTGQNASGDPIGEPLSYASLYWYVEWAYPPGEKEPFVLHCQNAQF